VGADEIRVEPPTASEVQRAEAKVAVAPTLRRAYVLRRVLEEHFLQSLAKLEVPGDGEAAVRTVDAAESATAADDAACAEALAPEMQGADDIGDALQYLVDVEAESAREVRLYEARRDLARSKAERAKAILWPIIEAWCKANEPPKGATWRFPTTPTEVRRETLKKFDVRVVNDGAAVKSLCALSWEDAMRAIRTKYEIESAELAAIVNERAGDPAFLAALKGVKVTPPGAQRMKMIRRGS